MEKRGKSSIVLSLIAIVCLLIALGIVYSLGMTVSTDSIGTFSNYVINGTTLLNFSILNTGQASDNITNVTISMTGNLSFISGSNISGISSNDFTSLGNSLYWNITTNFSGGAEAWFAFNVTPNGNIEYQNITIQITAYNTSGDFVVTNVTSYWVDNRSPGVSLLGSSIVLTNNQIVELNYSAEDILLGACTLYLNYSGSSLQANETNSSPVTGISDIFSLNLTEGNYSWNVLCNDTLGHSALNSTNYTITVDITSPYYDAVYFSQDNVSATSARGGDFFWMIVNWTDSLLNIDSAILYLNSTQANTTSTVTDGTALNLTYTIPSGFNGTYNVYMWANDTVGNSNQTLAISVKVLESVVPSPINLNLPINGKNSSNTTQLFNFTAYDNVDTSLSCNLTLDGAVNVSDISVVNGTDNITTVSGFSDGNHSWNITCWDLANNTNNSETYLFNVDTTSPTYDTTYFGEENVSSQTVNNGDFFWMIANWTDSLLNVDTAILYFNNVQANTTSTVTDGTALNLTYTIPSGFNGTYNVFMWANDTVGNSNQTINISVIVQDNIVPGPLTLNYPTNGANISSNSITFNFTAIDNVDTSLTCNLTLDGLIDLSNISVSNGTAELNTISGINESTHLWNVTCWDSINNTNSSETYSFTADTTVPVLNFNYTNTTTAIIGDTIFLVANYSDSLTSVDSVWIRVNGVRNETNSSGNLDNLNVSFTYAIPSSLSATVVNFTIVANDSAGNINNGTIIQVNVSDTIPPVMVLNYPINNSNLSMTNITFNFTATDIGDSSFTCNLTIDGSVNSSNISVTSGVSYVAYVNLLVSVHQWNVTCWDSADNINTSETFMFTIDQTPPSTAPYVLTVNDSNLDGNIEINFSADTNAAKYGIFRAGSNLTNATSATRLANITSTYFVDNTSSHDVEYWYGVTSIDSAGNENLSIINTSTGAFINATSNDTILPSIPSPLLNSTSGNTLNLSWNEILYDVSGNPDFTGMRYQIWYGTSINMSKVNISDTLDFLENVEFSSGNSTTWSIPSDCTSACRYYFVVTTIDDADNQNLSFSISNMVNLSLTYIDTSSDTTTTTSSSSGGGGTINTIQNEYSRGWGDSLDSFNFTIDRAHLPLTYVRFKLREAVGGVTFSAVASDSGPSHLTSLKYTAYSYIHIVTQKIDDSNILPPTLQFRVANSWLSDNGLNTNDISLFRYDGKWVELKTTYLKKDTTHSYFESVSPGFSYFAIASTKKFASPSSSTSSSGTGTQTNPSQQTTQQPPSNQGQEQGTTEEPDDGFDLSKINLFWPILIGIVFVVLAIGVVIFFIVSKKHDGSKNKDSLQKQVDHNKSYPQNATMSSASQQISRPVPKAIIDYLRTAVISNIDLQTARSALLSNGWPIYQVDAAMKFIPPKEILDYIKLCNSRNIPYIEISKALASKGWTQQQIQAAFNFLRKS